MTAPMTPEHPRWAAFLAQLTRAFITGHDRNHNMPLFTCPRDARLPVAAGILAQMADVDVDASLASLRAQVRCDCEIPALRFPRLP